MEKLQGGINVLIVGKPVGDQPETAKLFATLILPQWPRRAAKAGRARIRARCTPSPSGRGAEQRQVRKHQG